LAATFRVRIQVKARNFSLLQNFHTESGAHPASYSARTLELDVDRSPLSNAEFRNEWSYTATPHIYAFMA